MATYSEIEKIRTTQRHYVNYDFGKMSPQYADEFNILKPWCQYVLPGDPGYMTRAEIIKENKIKHDYYSQGNGQLDFSMMEKILRQYLPSNTPQEKKHAETMISYFKNLTTINNGEDNQATKAMMFATGSIDFPKLINDIGAAKGNPTAMSQVLQNLTQQVNAAAINGMFSKLLYIANKTGKDADTPATMDKKVEDEIIKLYERVIIGDNKLNKAINISNNPSEVFTLINNLNRELSKVDNKKGLSQQDVLKQVVGPFKTELNKELDRQKANGKNK